MKTIFKRSVSFKVWLIITMILVGAFFAQAISSRSMDPYYGAVVLDANTGKILWEDHASAQGYPASMVKMMNLFVVLDELDKGSISLGQKVVVSREVSQIGGRQVWLKEGEVLTLEELIYATAVHSANDAAMAIALVASGTKEAHVDKMNKKAKQLGLTNTEFHNVHGLPPSKGQSVDLSSALDMAKLANALIKAHPNVFKYTSVYMRDFRPGEHMVRLTSSNKLLKTFDGCDGMKTGYFRLGGFSITATAKRGNQRIIAVVMGCKDKKVRNKWAADLLEKGFSLVNK